MNYKIAALLCFLVLQRVNALAIHQITISTVSEESLQISLTTEAVELYYFDSWQYAITGDTITVEVLFVPGFGSTIAYLNNHFELPINTVQAQQYHLNVKCYYTFFREEYLQDSREGFFETPVEQTIPLSLNQWSKTDHERVQFGNPSNGKINISSTIEKLIIIDITGKMVASFAPKREMIDLYFLSDGLYWLSYLVDGELHTVRLILIKS